MLLLICVFPQLCVFLQEEAKILKNRQDKQKLSLAAQHFNSDNSKCNSKSIKTLQVHTDEHSHTYTHNTLTYTHTHTHAPAGQAEQLAKAAVNLYVPAGHNTHVDAGVVDVVGVDVGVDVVVFAGVDVVVFVVSVELKPAFILGFVLFAA